MQLDFEMKHHKNLIFVISKFCNRLIAEYLYYELEFINLYYKSKFSNVQINFTLNVEHLF